MRRMPSGARAAAALAVALLVALAAWAAPMLPGEPRLTDEIQSLADVDRVELVVMTLPKEMLDAGFKEPRIKETWEGDLKGAGLELDEGAEVPKLRLSVITVRDESVPDGIAYLLFLTFEQTVAVPRLDKQLFLPTWTGLKVGVHAKNQLAEGFRKTLADSIAQFVDRRRLASMHAE